MDVLIQNGHVLHLIRCPGELHETVTFELTKAFDRALEEVLQTRGWQDFVSWAGSTDSYLQNKQGCHSWQKKQPDSQLKLRKVIRAKQQFPVLVIEVASRHEDLHKLLCEGAMWLNRETDVQIVVLVKIWHTEKKLEIIIAGRSDFIYEAPGGVKCERLSLDQIRALPDLGRYYGMRILFHRIFDENSHLDDIIEVDMSDLFANSALDDVAHLLRQLRVNLRLVLKIIPELTEKARRS